LQMTNKLFIVAAGWRTTTGGHTFGTRSPVTLTETIVTMRVVRRNFWGVCSWSIGYRFALICNITNGSREDIGIQAHPRDARANSGRYLVATGKEGINARGCGRCGGSHMLENIAIAVNGKAQQFLSLLLLQHTHLLFKHLAMQSALPLVLDAFEFDTLGTITQTFVHGTTKQYSQL
jgi:hypothetical protein